MDDGNARLIVRVTGRRQVCLARGLVPAGAARNKKRSRRDKSEERGPYPEFAQKSRLLWTLTAQSWMHSV